VYDRCTPGHPGQDADARPEALDRRPRRRRLCDHARLDRDVPVAASIARHLQLGESLRPATLRRQRHPGSAPLPQHRSAGPLRSA